MLIYISTLEKDVTKNNEIINVLKIFNNSQKNIYILYVCYMFLLNDRQKKGKVKKRPVIIFDEGENLIFYGLNTKLSFPFRQLLNELKKGNINETRRRLCWIKYISTLFAFFQNIPFNVNDTYFQYIPMKSYFSFPARIPQ